MWMRWREYVNLCYRERARKSVFVSERETERGREGVREESWFDSKAKSGFSGAFKR